MTQGALDWSFSAGTPLEQQVLVALDLETTGLDPQSDAIIEVGAVKFRGAETLATLSTLVNPFRRINRFISDLTGIQQAELEGAPSWDHVMKDVARFIGEAPLIGHRVSFDVAFLNANGVRTPGALLDTFELASVLLPGGPDYSLEGLSVRFDIGHDSPHRALSDAEATRDLFNLFIEQLRGFDPGVLKELERVGTRSGWSGSEVARRVLAGLSPTERRSRLGWFGLDRTELSRRLRTPEKKNDTVVRSVSSEEIRDFFSPEGKLAEELPGYEFRPQQVVMAEAVTQAFDAGEHLVVEAGTGVGKSLAYLLPAALHALSGNGPVVVSTNTINLQEQLFNKDIPAVEAVLERMGIPRGTLRVAQLKGRANYLCLKRWAHAMSADDQDADSVRVLAKCLTWLQSTVSGDRAELALPRQEGFVFSRVSAQGAEGCPAPEGPCFLRRARIAAQEAHIVVVNHALLVSDIAMGGGLVPDHSALVIDEAHHLERVATRHLGFQVAQPQLESDLNLLGGDRGLLADAIRVVRASPGTSLWSHQVNEHAVRAQTDLTSVRRNTSAFFDLLGKITAGLLSDSGYGAELRITQAVRNQPAWSDLEIALENMDLALTTLETDLASVRDGLAKVVNSSDLEGEAVGLDLSAVIESVSKARAGLRQAVAQPSADQIYWITLARSDGASTVNGVPLRVGPILSEELFAKERSVVLTGGTLSSDDSFERLRTALGIPDSRSMSLGSPFNFEKAVLVAVPEDIPEPNRPGYNKAVAEVVRDLAVAVHDRILVLFTSNSALSTVRDLLKEMLEPHGIRVIGQGPDGSPYRIMRTLAAQKHIVALGSGSLWEGVDMETASVKVLVMPRLPFPVPSDPVFEARSEQYEDSFGEYAVPEAITRFRQGFGRLIRRHSDRGAFVILDRRVATRTYGRRFLNALPDCQVWRLPGRMIGRSVGEWLA